MKNKFQVLTTRDSIDELYPYQYELLMETLEETDYTIDDLEFIKVYTDRNREVLILN